MYRQLNRVSSAIGSAIRAATSGPQVLAFMPAVVLAGYWLGGELVLMLTALGFPAILALCAFLNPLGDGARGHTTGSGEFHKNMGRALSQAQKRSRKTACLVLGPDDFEVLTDRYGLTVAENVMSELATRLKSALRSRDLVTRLGDDRFGVVLAPVGYMNLDIALQMAERLQSKIEQPIKLGSATIYISTCVGFCLDSGFRADSGRKMADAAALALTVARRNGPSTIRAYSPDMHDVKTSAIKVNSDINVALENGEIRPWFQPQVSTDTGKITGFEALARWETPGRGIVSPAEFLPKIQKAGKMERLGEVMLSQALGALKKWDALGIDVPKVGINFSPEELRNPKLIQRVEWELDRLDLTAERLSVEILETVVATSPDDVVARNISGLSDLGCQIDLDDFGTGHASISSIRRFDIQRLKIDRSFVMKVDQDPEQQRMVSAILLMAERLDLDTLAEGVETAGEHAMLAQLGCRHVQGFGIGRPMPFDTTQQWVTEYLAKLSEPPEIGYKTG